MKQVRTKNAAKSSMSHEGTITYLIVMKSVQQESQDLGDPVKLLIEETFLRQLVVHL